VNAVSPPRVTETLRALGMEPSHGLPVAVVARSYVLAAAATLVGTPARCHRTKNASLGVNTLSLVAAATSLKTENGVSS